ncbi:bacillithiol biosynthesis cysteine-adding enzyme BshC [Flavobacterium amnicola]|uniref:Putative cysteine ligase BshC n=1 Tax=Flavobacterium amnicola TaxID=2506422 RepID=A0A4Q1K1G5_9FLAO|nr:bacillithiol biosynthesis cysteine-adding enzyme BshC [Flavobacterium amnicola]RXR18421.1 bacillithiol biosynthesis cysteine-adding enzyme BshC [Flavobacterium amnicola]
MPTDCITYQESGYFSKLIVDYLNEKEALQSLYNRFPSFENIKEQVAEKSKNYSVENRIILEAALFKQNQDFDLSLASLNNIKLLQQENTFTITTGHQLNLFTGPLYFIYKIADTINLCKALRQKYPENNFVPIYWMATEDHDFEEINHFKFKGKKIVWNTTSNGPVGRLSTQGLQEVYNAFSSELGLGDNASYLKELFKKAYLEHSNLADATRYLVNELFKNEGLVILDGDDTELKKLFIPTIKDELLQQTSHKKVTETIQNFKYDVQVNPREINLFYIENDLRERIILENGKYKINNTDSVFTPTEILELVENSPEKISPNVILRPLYQEIILPNLSYIGGGGEIAYWLELKSMFEAHNITFPMLLLRNSVVIASEKQMQKADKLELTWGNLFSKQIDLINSKAKELSKFNIDFSEQKIILQQQFEKLNQIALQTDKSFIGAVKAQEAKQTKGLDNLEKRLLKAEKRVHSEKLAHITTLQNELFPNQSLQERQLNFAEFYLNNSNFISLVLSKLEPLKKHFLSIID